MARAKKQYMDNEVIVNPHHRKGTMDDMAMFDRAEDLRWKNYDKWERENERWNDTTSVGARFEKKELRERNAKKTQRNHEVGHKVDNSKLKLSSKQRLLRAIKDRK